MALLTLFTNMTFYHLSLLTFILGAQIYQSFIANITASNALTRGQFRILQAAIWPMYFKLQMIVSILLALTYPGGNGKGALFPGSASVQGVFGADDRLTVSLPLALMFAFSAANVVYVAPNTISTMWKLHLESVREEKARGNVAAESQDDKNNFESVRDRKTIQQDGAKSPELKALTYKFLAFHGASYGCNMATIASSVCYALFLAARGL